jgi:glycosyltransferase involved in cell wall biosynthesis
VPPGDAVALGAALKKLLDDPALARTLGDNGRRRAEAVFSRDDTVKTFMRVVETVVQRPDARNQRILQAEPL